MLDVGGMLTPLGVRLQLQSVTLKSSRYNLKDRLMRSSLLPWAPIEINSSLALPAIVNAAPLASDVVEWMQCLPSGHLIVTEGGLKDISDIGVGENVLTHNGTFTKVTETFKRPYRGKLIGLKLVGYPDTIWFTPEHPILVGMKELRGSGYRERKYRTGWIKAGDVGGAFKRGMFCLLPMPRVNGNGFAKPSKPLARFLGYYLSEGCAYHKYRSYVVQLSNTESRIIEDIRNCVREAFGKEPLVRDDGNVESVIFWSKEAYLWLKDSFGLNCYDKQIPGWLLGWPPELLKELLDAYWLGDGSNQSRNGYERIAYHTVSKKLALGLRLLELKLRRETTISRRSNPNAFIVYVNNPEGREDSPQVMLMDGYLWMPIEDVEVRDFDGYVYNLEVEGDNSYVAETISVHNCAAADNAVFDGMCEDYNRLGSQLLSGSGDAYIPGVRVGDIRGESVDGGTVRARGYGTVITPVGSFNVPVRGKATFARGDILAWAALPDPGTGVQWLLTLLQWRDLARAPIFERVRFASSSGLVAPNFFSIPASFTPIRTLRIGITSDKPQTITVRCRGTKGEFENILAEDSLRIDAGESEVIYNVIGVPFVRAFTLELAPSDNTQTILDYIDMIPPF